MQRHRPSTSIIVIPSHAKSSLRNYAQAVVISMAYVLKSYFPMTKIIMAAAAVTFVTLFTLRETYRAPFGADPRTTAAK